MNFFNSVAVDEREGIDVPGSEDSPRIVAAGEQKAPNRRISYGAEAWSALMSTGGQHCSRFVSTFCWFCAFRLRLGRESAIILRVFWDKSLKRIISIPIYKRQQK